VSWIVQLVGKTPKLEVEATCCRMITPAQPAYPAASVRDYCSGAYIQTIEDLAKRRLVIGGLQQQNHSHHDSELK
jgi:hypothetical protein